MDTDERAQELDQLEQDAKEAGRAVKERNLYEKRVMSEAAQVAFASALAQMYIQKQFAHIEAKDITFYMALYLQCFRNGYDEVKLEGDVTYHPSIFD